MDHMPMSDEAHDAILSRVEKRLDEVARMLLGNGKVGVVAQVLHNRDAIDDFGVAIEDVRDEMRRELAMMRKSLDKRSTTDPELEKIRWHVVGQAVAAGAGALAFLMHMFGG